MNLSVKTKRQVMFSNRSSIYSVMDHTRVCVTFSLTEIESVIGRCY